MPPPENPAPQLFDHTHKLLRAHEVLLSDAVRNQAFYQALKKRVTTDSVVLDIGAGTGIWAVTAAKLGAQKVVAVETDGLLAGLIKTFASEQGVADQVEVVIGNSFDTKLEKEFDIVVSETIGTLGFDENIFEIMRDARRRFLKKGGSIIPENVSLHCAPARLEMVRDIIPSGLPFDFVRLTELNLHSPQTLAQKSDAKLLAAPQLLIEIDLSDDAAAPPALENLRASWDALPPSDSINCFLVWVGSVLTAGVNLSTAETTSWLPNVYRVAPPPGNFTRAEFELSLTAASNYWTATFIDGNTRITRRYSPEFAAAELTILSRTDNPALLDLVNRVPKT